MAMLLAAPSIVGAANDVYPQVVEIPAGPFIMGSDAAEREAGYRLDEKAYGHSITRTQRWYAGETQRGTREFPLPERPSPIASTPHSSTTPAMRRPM